MVWVSLTLVLCVLCGFWIHQNDWVFQVIERIPQIRFSLDRQSDISVALQSHRHDIRRSIINGYIKTIHRWPYWLYGWRGSVQNHGHLLLDSLDIFDSNKVCIDHRFSAIFIGYIYDSCCLLLYYFSISLEMFLHFKNKFDIVVTYHKLS